MRIKFSSVIAVISILLYVAAIGTGIVRIRMSINERRDIARREFYDLTDIASSVEARGFMEEPFKEAVRSAVQNSNTLQAVIVTGGGRDDFAFERGNKGLIIREAGGPQFRTRFGYSLIPLAPLRIDGLRNATITAVSNDIDVPSLQTVLVQSLLIAVAAVLLSAITLLYALWNRKPVLVSDKMREIISQAPEPPLKQEPVFEAPVPEPPEPPSFAEEPDPLPTGMAAETTEEAGIQETLDAELRRCSDTEQDLALILMELSPGAGAGIGDDALVYRTFGGKVRQFFTIRDIVVENGDRGISIILPGSSLEEGFAKARQFYDQMLTGLPELFPNKDDLRIGVSALSGRILATDRLLLEASKALERAALEPTSPIVAFKSDPAKYKAFVQKQGKKAK